MNALLNQINNLEIILKTVERCNINCSYCYFFNGKDNSYLKHPPYIAKSTVENIALFLKQGCNELATKNLRIDLHGGEPLMQKIKDFENMCDIFLQTIDPATRVMFSVQTNGMLLNEEWLQTLAKYQVRIGISLDGPAKYNDLYRIDKRGRGTYAKSCSGIKAAQDFAKTGAMSKPGVLCVINPDHSPREIYRHFVDYLEFDNIDFLLPDMTHDDIASIENFSAEQYGKFLCEILDEWTRDDNPNISIRILNSYMSSMLGGKSSLSSIGNVKHDYAAFTISSNGLVAPDDTMRSSNPDYMNLGLNVTNSTLKQFLNHPFMQFLRSSEDEIPENCHGCEWLNICRGGFLIHRYAKESLFTNTSVMCSGLKLIYREIYNYLINHGISNSMIQQVLTK